MIKIVAIAGSLRQDSFNRKALQVAKSFITDPDLDMQEVDLKELDLPVFDADQEAKATPESAKRIQEAFDEADLIVIATPEYNRSIPGGLKNAIDWVSRTRPKPLSNKVVVMLGASTGGFGTVRSQIHLRQVLMALGAYIIPIPEIYISKAEEAFNEDGSLKDETTTENIKTLVHTGIDLARKLKS